MSRFRYSRLTTGLMLPLLPVLFVLELAWSGLKGLPDALEMSVEVVLYIFTGRE